MVKKVKKEENLTLLFGQSTEKAYICADNP